jgi:hypothetical protein
MEVLAVVESRGKQRRELCRDFRMTLFGLQSVMTTKPLDDRIGAFARTAGCPFKVLLYHLLLNAMLA